MAANDDVKKLKELIDNPSVKAGGKTRYKNKSYSLAELNELLKAAEKLAKEEADARMVQSGKAFEAQGNLEIQLQLEKSALKEKTMRARDTLEFALADLNLALQNNGDIPKAQQKVRDAYLGLQVVNPKDKMLEGVSLPSISRLGAEREGGLGAAPLSNNDVSIADRASQQSIAEKTAADTAQGTKTQIVTKNGVQVKVTTDSAGKTTETPVSSAAAGTQVTAPSTAVATSAIGKGTRVTKQTVAPATDWEATFRQYVPSKAWMLDLDRTKYPQLFALLKTAADQHYYESQEGLQRFSNELDATDFYKELADSSQRRDIKKLVGDLGFDNTDFSKFVSDSINFGWEGETLKQKTYEEVFRRNPDGTYTNPTAVARATKGNDYLGVQLTAKAYFNNASPAAIERVLTGQITSDDFARQQRELAKTRYGHLASLIDQGVTLEDLAANYKSSAAKLLEIDPNQIDMSQADYEVALAYDDNGNKRAMTTGEWEKMLRSDPRYGWEKTNNAKTEARALASNIAQAFGRII